MRSTCPTTTRSSPWASHAIRLSIAVEAEVARAVHELRALLRRRARPHRLDLQGRLVEVTEARREHVQARRHELDDPQRSPRDHQRLARPDCDELLTAGDADPVAGAAPQAEPRTAVATSRSPCSAARTNCSWPIVTTACSGASAFAARATAASAREERPRRAPGRCRSGGARRRHRRLRDTSGPPSARCRAGLRNDRPRCRGRSPRSRATRRQVAPPRTGATTRVRRRVPRRDDHGQRRRHLLG